ncbi:MAG TPA: ATP-grasp domain-containing protein [Streptosporangiaceae bacterium]|nr:ATP-grasp domain-containing protein [Streptosporangiaceae bacterium]
MLLVVEPWSAGGLIVHAARDLGYEVAVVSFDRPGDDRLLDQEVRDDADHVIVTDTNDLPATLEAVLRFHQHTPISGVAPGFEFYVPLAAAISARLNLPGLPHACWVRNKLAMLDRVRMAGERVPRYRSACSPDGAAAAAAQVGVPCVIKPVDSAGSIHVRRVESADEARAAFDEFCRDERLDFGKRTSTHVLVTEYLDGPEYSVEGLVFQGTITIASVTAKLLGPEPCFVEMGHIVPADIPPATRSRIERYVRSVIRATELTVGPFHCELRVVGGDPVLIEIAARLPGDHIVDLVEYATGSSLARAAVAAYMGEAPIDGRAPARAPYAGIRFFTVSPGTGSYARAMGMTDARRHPGVIDVRATIAPGQPIPPPDDSRCRVGHAIFLAGTYQSALDTWSALGKLVTFG